MLLHPASGGDQPVRQQFDVKTQRAGHHVLAFFVLRQQVKQQSSDARLADRACDELIARAVTAAAAAVNEQHHTRRIGWQIQITIKLHFTGRDGDR